MDYKLRTLKTGDIFKMSKILKKMDLKVELNKKVSQQQFGFDLMKLVLENVHIAEEEINEFLADLSGLTTQEFAELPFEDTIKIFNEFKNLDGIGSFFKLANK